MTDTHPGFTHTPDQGEAGRGTGATYKQEYFDYEGMTPPPPEPSNARHREIYFNGVHALFDCQQREKHQRACRLVLEAHILETQGPDALDGIYLNSGIDP